MSDTNGAGVFGATLVLSAPRVGPLAAGTDRLGSFRLAPVPPGSYELSVTALGYAAHRRELTIGAGETLELEIALERSAIPVEGIEVEADRSRARVQFEETAGATVREMELEELRAVPGVAEADPVRAIEVLPGVVSTSDFSAAFHVRGGSADQNLILLDGVPIFSPFHLGGLFSVFNTDMIDRVSLQSGGFAAEHGGRVSSVLEIESEAGAGDFAVDAGVSLLATRLALGGRMPDALADGLGQADLRYRVSARRSYLDVVMKPAFEFPYHLTDFQGVVEGWSPSGDRLSVTAYTGRDVLDLTRLDPEEFPLRIDWDWGNDLAGLRWTRPRAGGGSLDLRANFSRFGTGLAFPDFEDTEFSSHIRQAQARADLDTRPTPRWTVRTGASVEHMAYENRLRSGGTSFAEGDGSGWLFGTYVQAAWSTPRRWLVEGGVRYDAWIPEPGDLTQEVSPRLAVKRFLGDGDHAVKLAAGRYSQFLHSLRDEELPLGLDIWLLAGERAPHVVSDQLQLGIEGYLAGDWFWSVEGYVRGFDGVVTFNSADDPNDDADDLVDGTGLSYGADLLVRRERGDLTGWIALSLLRAERTFADRISPLEPKPTVTYPPIFDKTIDLDLVLRYVLPWNVEGGLRWNVSTGVPYTRALGAYAYYSPRFVSGGGLEWTGVGDTTGDGGYAVVLEDRNASRYPAYHRLDVSARRPFEKSWGTLTPYLNLLNVYNRKNVLFYFFQYEEDPPVRSGVSMFPILPTIGLEVTF